MEENYFAEQTDCKYRDNILYFICNSNLTQIMSRLGDNNTNVPMLQIRLWDGARSGQVQLPGHPEHLEPLVRVQTRLGCVDTTQ